MEKELGPGGKFQSTSGLAAKLGEHAARLAAMMTVYESDEDKEISKEVLDRAIKVAEYYVKTALRVHGASQANVDLLEAESLLKWLQNKWCADHGANFSLTDVVQLGPNSIRDVDKAQRLIAILERYRHITKVKDVTIRGRKRRVAWQLKNRVFGQ